MVQKRKLPVEITVELLKHMSEEGRFEQTLSDFPDLNLQEIRQTFAWLADELSQRVGPADGEMIPQTVMEDLLGGEEVSSETKRVLDQLSPQESYLLLKNFGAVD